MDESVKKAMQDAKRLHKLAVPSIADEAARICASGALEKLIGKSSGITAAKEQLEAIKNLRDVSIPTMPYLQPFRPPQISTFEDTNQFQSAAVLLRRLADAIRQWRTKLPENLQPAILALLNGGVQIDVSGLAQECFHGIRIEGQIQGQACVVLAHQSTVQLLCIAQPIIPPEKPKRGIGFIIEGESSVA